MSRSKNATFKLNVQRCVKLINKYEYRIDQMKKRQEMLRSTLLTLKAQIETKEMTLNALSDK